MRLILGREPAVFWAMVATLAQAVLLLIPGVDVEVQGAANAVILAVAGFLTAAWVSVDAALPALTGLIKAVFALILAFGVNLPESTQVGILAVVAGVFAFFERQNVTAKVGPSQPAAHVREV
jgi:hypothetical protein